MVIETVGPTIMLLIYIALVVGIANICLLLGLLHVYWKTYKEIKSKFTIGLLYFASVLLIQNILVTIALILPLLNNFIPPGIANSEFGRPHFTFFFINLIQLVALTILYMITKE